MTWVEYFALQQRLRRFSGGVTDTRQLRQLY
jgi:hypothetical protein